MHVNLCMHILASTCQDGDNPFPVIRLPVVNSVTDSSRHTLLLVGTLSEWTGRHSLICISQKSFAYFDSRLVPGGRLLNRKPTREPTSCVLVVISRLLRGIQPKMTLF